MGEDRSRFRLHVAGYQRELERVEKFIEHIKNALAERFILNFYAPHSFGKTTFLALLWDTYEESLPTCRVSIGSFHREDGPFDLCGLLVKVIQELEYRLPRRIAGLPPEYHASTDEEWLAGLLVDLAKGIAEKHWVLLMLLDDFDALPGQARCWFEARILSPLAMTKRAGLVLTSEFELRFTERIDLRMRRVSYELPRFEAETLTSTFPEYEEIMPEILKASGGLPLLTDGFIQELEECKITTAEDFRAQERGLLKRYYRDHVDQMLSEGFNASTRETVLVLALLRRFDVKVLKGILPKVLAAYYDGYGTADYIELIERLGSWVYWRIQGGYAVNEAFRMALQGYVRFEKPQLYRKTHIAAEKLYEDLLQQGCRVDCLVELLYHRLALLESNNKVEPSTIPARLGDWLQEHLPGSLTTSELISLRNCLLQDPDLKDYVSEDSLNMINGLVEEAAQSEQGSVLEFQAKSA